jgi:AmmeMemoRadiSam system protein B
MRVRPSAFAGTFYPDKPQELAAVVKSHLSKSAKTASAARTMLVKAIVAPHAGYIYSGTTAGAAYAAVSARRDEIERVVLLGPSHRVGFSGIASSGASVFETPLGPVTVDRDAVTALTTAGLAREFEGAHDDEHSLEVQLPFIKTVFPSAHIVPLLAGDEDWQACERVLAALWGKDETLIVISSDLSHYHDYATAQHLDGETAKQIESLAAGGIDHEQACGATAINGILGIAADKKMSCQTLELRNSGDTVGAKNRVVGYGAFAIG